jgi:alkaline phosphatase
LCGACVGPCATGEVPVHDVTGEGGGVGYTQRNEPVGPILEGAQLAGKLTGIVTTTRVTHATPAAFSTHVRDRDDENEIAREQIFSLDVNVLMGSGRRHFDPRSTAGSARADHVDLIAMGLYKLHSIDPELESG